MASTAAAQRASTTSPTAASVARCHRRRRRPRMPPTPPTLSRGADSPWILIPRASAGRNNTRGVAATGNGTSRSSPTATRATAGDVAGPADDDGAPSSSTSSPSPSSSVPSDLVEVATFGAPHGVRGEIRCFLVTDDPEERLLGAPPTTGFWVAPRDDGGGRGGILLGRGRGGSRSPGSDALGPRLVRIEGARPAPLSRGSRSKSSSSPLPSSWLLKLRGVDTPESAAALANNSLWVSAAERPALPESGDDFYAQELIGMSAHFEPGAEGSGEGGEGTERGRLVGVVVDVCGGGGGADLLRLELSDDEGGGEADEEVEAATRQRPRKSERLPPRQVAAKRTVLLPFTSAFVPTIDRATRRMTICPPDGLLDLAILPPKAQLKQQREEMEQREAAAAAKAAAAAGAGGGGGGDGDDKSTTKPRRPRGRRARDRAGGEAAPPFA